MLIVLSAHFLMERQGLILQTFMLRNNFTEVYIAIEVNKENCLNTCSQDLGLNAFKHTVHCATCVLH